MILTAPARASGSPSASGAPTLMGISELTASTNLDYGILTCSAVAVVVLDAPPSSRFSVSDHNDSVCPCLGR